MSLPDEAAPTIRTNSQPDPSSVYGELASGLELAPGTVRVVFQLAAIVKDVLVHYMDDGWARCPSS